MEEELLDQLLRNDIAILGYLIATGGKEVKALEDAYRASKEILADIEGLEGR